MAQEWAGAYEAPSSLDESRMIGTRPRRPTLWALAAAGVSLPLIAVWLMLSIVVAAGNLFTHLLLVPLVVWLLLCYTMANDWGMRPAEHWIRAWRRYRKLPKTLVGESVVKHHAKLTDIPRGVVKVEGTANLRMASSENLGNMVKRLAVFFNGLSFPVQIIVRTWSKDSQIERAWYVAFTAESEEIRDSRIEDVINGLKRAGLSGRGLNGDLYDNLHTCWTSAPRNGHVGPNKMIISSRGVIVDDEHLRGFLLSKMPRMTDPNCLCQIIDGDLPVDFSMWLEPTDNGDQLDYLRTRVVEWQTAQHLNVMSSGIPDPDIDDCIKDAARTKLLLRHRELRVFLTTIAFVVRGKTSEQRDQRERLLNQQIREQIGDNALIPLDLEHDRAPLLVVPTGEPSVSYPLRSVTPQIARCYPFSNSSLSMDGGVDVGTSVGSKRRNLLNLFTLANPHVVVLGNSGAGKGFWIKVFLYRLLREHHRPSISVTIIQSEKDEYSALANAVANQDGKHADWRGKVVRIGSLDEISKIYVTGNKDKGWITLSSLQVYDLTSMATETRGEAIARLLNAIHLNSQVHPGILQVVVIDELGIVIDSDAAARAIEVAYRRFRSIPNKDNPEVVSRVAMIGASQRPSDLLNNVHGKVPADLAMTHVYFRVKPTEMEVVKNKLKLSSDEAEFLEQCDEGTALLVADRARVGLHLFANPVEEAFAKT
jgi:hypothetical protein